MKRKIILEIVGTQKFDGEDDKIEMTTVGTLDEDEKAYIISYTEEQEPPLDNVDATVKIYKDNSAAEMTRTGLGESCLMIEKSKRNLCHYATGYGDMLMGIFGKTIEGEVNDKEGKFSLCYDIDINGSLTSQNEVNLTFKNNQEN